MAGESLNKKRAKNKGRKQNRQTRKGRSRGSAPRDFWHRPGPKVSLGRERFRVTLMRGRRLPWVRLDSMVEGISWLDESAIMSGEIGLRLPQRKDVRFPVQVGHQVKLEMAVNATAPFKELWRMRVSKPNKSLSSGTVAYQLTSDLALAHGSEDDWRFVKNTRHPHGWRGDEIIREVAKRAGLKIRLLPRMRHRHKRLIMLGVSPLDVIVKVLEVERTNHSRRFAIYFERGKLEIRPLRRSRLLLRMGKSIIDGVLSAQMPENFATAVTVRTSGSQESTKDSKGHRRTARQKIVVKVKLPAAVDRYGYVHRIVYAQDADSPAEARRLGRRYLARMSRPEREATITHPGIPWVRRLQAIRLDLPEQGVKQIVYVKTASYRLSPGGFDMELTLDFDDPFVDEKAHKVTEELTEKAKKNGRKAKKPERKQKRNVPKRGQDRQTGTGKPPRLGQTPTPVRSKT